MVAAEHLGELGGLPVAHRAGHGLDRQRARQEQLSGAIHAGSLELSAERGAPDLGQGALKLAAARGDLVRHAPERQVRIGVAEPDHLERLAVEVPPSLHRGWPHEGEYGPSAPTDHQLNWRVWRSAPG